MSASLTGDAHSKVSWVQGGPGGVPGPGGAGLNQELGAPGPIAEPLGCLSHLCQLQGGRLLGC